MKDMDYKYVHQGKGIKKWKSEILYKIERERERERGA
jgi:hypothetical protein